MNALVERLRQSPKAVVLVFVAIAVVVVVIGNLVGGGGQSAVTPSPATSSLPVTRLSPTTSVPTAVSTLDDNARDLPDQASTITSGERDPRAFAVDFAASWLNTSNKTARQWLDGFADRVTPDLRDLLADVDPLTVPVGRIVDGGVQVLSGGDELLLVRVPLDTGGMVTLTLSGRTHRWLVSEIDWSGR